LKNKNIIICDLDDTLANHEIRNRLYHRSGGNYDILFSPELVVFDTVNERVKLLLDTFRALDYEIFILSARPDSMLSATETWLNNNKIVYDNIKLKEKKNKYQLSAEWKVNYVKMITRPGKLTLAKFNIAFAIDDWPPVIKAFEEIGIKVFDAKKINTI